MSKNFTVTHKLCLAMGVLLLLMAAMGGGTVFSIRKIADQAEVIELRAYPLAQAAADAQMKVERYMAVIDAAGTASRRGGAGPRPRPAPRAGGAGSRRARA